MKTIISVFFLILFLLIQPLAAKVVRVEVKERKEVANVPDIARTGPYEIVKGVIYLEVNPDDPANQGYRRPAIGSQKQKRQCRMFDRFRIASTRRARVAAIGA